MYCLQSKNTGLVVLLILTTEIGIQIAIPVLNEELKVASEIVIVGLL
jgi:hypothetical protein